MPFSIVPTVAYLLCSALIRTTLAIPRAMYDLESLSERLESVRRFAHATGEMLSLIPTLSNEPGPSCLQAVV